LKDFGRKFTNFLFITQTCYEEKESFSLEVNNFVILNIKLVLILLIFIE